MAQCRYDDPSRQRSVQRQLSVAAAPVSLQLSSNQIKSSAIVLESDDDEDDNDDDDDDDDDDGDGGGVGGGGDEAEEDVAAEQDLSQGVSVKWFWLGDSQHGSQDTWVEFSAQVRSRCQ
eukprot:COSAG01_NODE_2234_length_8097_cov_5.001500_12_plen_119_part_00